MNGDSYASALGDIAAKMLEEAAFVFTEPAEGVPSWNGDVVEASLAFSGDGDGRLSVTAPRQFGVELAANLLGIAPEEDPDVQTRGEEALGEMLNMIAGPLVEAWFGHQAAWQIGVPEARTVSSHTRKAQTGAATCRVMLVTEDRYPIELVAVIEGK